MASVHTRRLRAIPIAEMDPSMLLGFLIKNEDDWLDWKRRVADISGKGSIIRIYASSSSSSSAAASASAAAADASASSTVLAAEGASSAGFSSISASDTGFVVREERADAVDEVESFDDEDYDEDEDKTPTEVGI